LKHDVSLPILPALTCFEAFPDRRLFVFGHLGDGNLHYVAHGWSPVTALLRRWS
jgi:hypothetical protein